MKSTISKMFITQWFSLYNETTDKMPAHMGFGATTTVPHKKINLNNLLLITFISFSSFAQMSLAKLQTAVMQAEWWIFS